MDKSRETLKKWHHMMVTVTFITLGHKLVTSLRPRSQEKQVFVRARSEKNAALETSAKINNEVSHDSMRPRGCSVTEVS
jgi:hypothetical protein